MRLLLRYIGLLGALSLIPLAACSNGDSGPTAGIKIGVDMPLSGGSAEAELVRIANGIKVYPTAAFPWLGR